MWKNSIVEIAKRAGKKQALHRAHKAAKIISVDRRILVSSTSNTPSQIFSHESNTLYASQDDFRTQQKGRILQSSLENEKHSVRAADDNEILLQQARRLPFLYAQQAFCALIKAGEVELALQLATFWQTKKASNLRASRHKAKKELKETINVLKKLKDTTTLKALINILSEAVKEQSFGQKELLHSVALTHSHEYITNAQYKLFVPLGVNATSDILTHAVEAACHLGKEDGMSVFEKVLLADQCASCSVSEILPGGTPRLPFALFQQIGSLLVTEPLDDTLLQQVCPEVTNKFVHPSHYRIADILSLSVEEARFIEQHWQAENVFSAPLESHSLSSKLWRSLTLRVLPESPFLQSVNEKRLLVNLMAHSSSFKNLVHDQTWSNLRAHLIALLKNPQRAVRRFTASTLLKNNNLVRALQISPVEIATIYAQTFYSKRNVDPALCTFCNFAMRRLCQKKRYQDAARLAWNHLSVDCQATKNLYRASPAAVDLAVLSISRAMLGAASEDGAQRWMGYRSLALLRLAAASGNNVTVLHSVPVCVNAMDCCGVSFAAVNEVLSEVFSADEAQKNWAINLVRLCSESETVPMQRLPRCRGIASEFSPFHESVFGIKGGLEHNTVLRTPSRCKQLALWETVNKPENNPLLSILMLAVFLSESTRKEILNCSFLLNSPADSFNSSIKSTFDTGVLTANDIWSWEVVASIASNCTSPESYQTFLKCLKQRRPIPARVSSTELDNISAVMLSELEGNISPNSKTVVSGK